MKQTDRQTDDQLLAAALMCSSCFVTVVQLVDKIPDRHCRYLLPNNCA